MLEGNNFLVSILLTVVLSGIIVFYFRQQITTLENKLTSMFQLIQSITSELNKINDILVKENDETPYLEETNEEETNEEVVIKQDFSTEEEKPQVLEQTMHPNPLSNIQIHAVNLSSFKEPLVPDINTSDIKVVEIIDENESESDESELETDSEDETIELEVIKQGSDSDKIEIKSEENLEDNKKLNIVDYNKLPVADLRKIVEDKGIVTDAKKLKKKEIVELLG